MGQKTASHIKISFIFVNVLQSWAKCHEETCQREFFYDEMPLLPHTVSGSEAHSIGRSVPGSKIRIPLPQQVISFKKVSTHKSWVKKLQKSTTSSTRLLLRVLNTTRWLSVVCTIHYLNCTTDCGKVGDPSRLVCEMWWTANAAGSIVCWCLL